ncbi:MAG: right-handed parallel beta-helix repeat-containing protein, partial [Cyclobacteriaceae bacterium]
MSRYFFSNSGDDSNSGNSAESPWKSIEKINEINIEPGTEILLKAGDYFRGKISLKSSGSTGNPIVIKSYGSGNKPVLAGSISVKVSEKINQNTVSCKVDKKVKGVFYNGEWLNLARYPSKGFFSIDAGDKMSLTDRELLLQNIDCTGAAARIRAVNWQYEIAKIAKHEKDTLFFAEKMIYQCNKDYGYFLDDKFEFLTEPGEWFHDFEKGILYFIPPETSADADQVEVVTHDVGIDVGSSNYIQISDLRFENYYLAGVLGKTGAGNISIKNCVFKNIHQDAISLESGTKNFEISDNQISQIKGRGIACLDSEDCRITHNQIFEIGHYPGYGFDGVNNGTGIAILKTELVYQLDEAVLDKLSGKIPEDVIDSLTPYIGFPFPDEKFLISFLQDKIDQITKSDLENIGSTVRENLAGFGFDSANNYVGYNHISSTGLHSIRIDGKNHLCEFNLVKDSLLFMNDGSSIYSWAQNYDYSVGTVIRKNIIIHSKGNVIATPDFHRFAHGIYLDNKCVGFTISENVVTGTTWGILINDEARQHTIEKNICFDNDMGLVFSEYFMPGTLFGCEAYDNILFARKRPQRTLFIESRISASFDPVITDRNFYGSSYYTFPIITLTFKNGHRVWHEYDLKSWQSVSGRDKNSRYFAPPDPEARPRMSQLIINESLEPKEFPIDNTIRDHFDIDGNKLGDTVTISPFSAM